MPTLYENYITGDDYDFPIEAADWEGQTFTSGISHAVTSVKLKLYRVGSPGTITASIRATSAGGTPTGSDLASGTIDGNTLTTVSPGQWYEITIGAGAALTANAKYAIVVRAPSGSLNVNYFLCRGDITSPTYTGGAEVFSDNSGSTWVETTANELLFEDWGSGFIPKVFIM